MVFSALADLEPGADRRTARQVGSGDAGRGDRRGYGLAQSTVSQHLKILADVRFVLIESAGNARHYRINEACVLCFLRRRCGDGQTPTIFGAPC